MPPLETVAGRAYREMRSRILAGQLKPGEPIRQGSLARELGVGTNPLREAMVRLDCDGLIEMVPMWGAMVRSWSREDLRHMHELRLALECAIARLCAERATEAELAELEKIAQQLDALADQPLDQIDWQEVGRLDVAFHQQVARSARSPMLQAQYERSAAHRLMINAGVRTAPGRTPWKQGRHAPLIEAFQARNPDQAEAATRVHLANAMHNLLQHAEEPAP